MAIHHVRHGRLRRLQLLRHGCLKQKGRTAAAPLSAAAVSPEPTPCAVTAAVSSSVAAGGAAAAAAEAAAEAAKSSGLSDVALRNIALEAVRTSNYWAEPEQQDEVILYILTELAALLANQKWLRKNATKVLVENGLTRRYTVTEILTKRHEADGFDVFVKADEAIAAADADAAKAALSKSAYINAGMTVCAKKETRIFASTTSWQQIGSLSAGQRAEAAGSETTVEGLHGSGNYCMVPIKPEGAVEKKYIEVEGAIGLVPLATIATADAVSTGNKTMDESDPGKLEEIREGIAAVVAAEEAASDSVGADKILELLEGCASLGELGAAVYCGERLEALHREGSDVKLPKEVLDRAFEAFKPLMRPCNAKVVPSLHGPWSKPPPGRAGVPNQRKSFGKLMNRLATARQEKELAQGGEEVQRERAEAAANEQALLNFCQVIAPLLGNDSKVAASKRRGNMGEEVVRVCGEHGLKVSSGLTWVLIGQLETMGIVTSRGRDLHFDIEAARGLGGKQIHQALPSLKLDLDVLEALARERLGRRNKRQKARLEGKYAKKRRLNDE